MTQQNWIGQILGGRISLFTLLLLLIGAIAFRAVTFRETSSLNLNSFRLNKLFSNTPSFSSEISDFSKDRAEEIERSLNIWVSKGSTNPRVWQKLALLNAWHGNIAEAAWQWEKADETIGDLITRGLNVENSHNGAKNAPLNTNNWYEIGLSIDPEIRDLWIYQGISYRKQNQTEMAIDALQNSLQASRSYEMGVGDAHLQLAEIYKSELLLEIALDHLDKALTANDFKDSEPSTIQAHYLQAEILNQLGQKEQALAEYKFVLSLQENHYWALTRMGQLTWALSGDADQAIEFIITAITINNRPKMGYKALGNIYCQTGFVNDAISVYQEVLRRDPGDAVALKVVNNDSCRQNN